LYRLEKHAFVQKCEKAVGKDGDCTER